MKPCPVPSTSKFEVTMFNAFTRKILYTEGKNLAINFGDLQFRRNYRIYNFTISKIYVDKCLCTMQSLKLLCPMHLQEKYYILMEKI